MKITKFPRRVSMALTKLGPLLLANVVLFAYSVIDTVLVSASAHFDVKLDLNYLHLSPIVWSIFFVVLRSDASGISNSAWQTKIKI